VPSPRDINVLPVDEDVGMEIEWGIRDRTINKVIADYGNKDVQYCVLDDDGP
jgi:hypothetical protein